MFGRQSSPSSFSASGHHGPRKVQREPAGFVQAATPLGSRAQAPLVQNQCFRAPTPRGSRTVGRAARTPPRDRSSALAIGFGGGAVTSRGTSWAASVGGRSSATGSSGCPAATTTQAPDRFLELNVSLCRVLANWASVESKRVVDDAYDFVGTGPWGIDQVKRFGYTVLVSHGQTPPRWSDKIWADLAIAGAEDFRPSCAEEARRLAKRILQRLSTEMRVKVSGGLSSVSAPVANSAQVVGSAAPVNATRSTSPCSRPTSSSTDLRNDAEKPVGKRGPHVGVSLTAAGVRGRLSSTRSQSVSEDEGRPVSRRQRSGTPCPQVAKWRSSSDVAVRSVVASRPTQRSRASSPSDFGSAPGRALVRSSSAAGQMTTRLQASRTRRPANRGESGAENGTESAPAKHEESSPRAGRVSPAAPEQFAQLPPQAEPMAEPSVCAEETSLMFSDSTPGASISKAGSVGMTPSECSTASRQPREQDCLMETPRESLTFTESRAVWRPPTLGSSTHCWRETVKAKLVAASVSPKHGQETVKEVQQGLHDGSFHLVLFYRKKCMELTSQVRERDVQIQELHQALMEARSQASGSDTCGDTVALESGDDLAPRHIP